ncbi:DNA-binding transcriptional ArsR family regulator OS=Streptomyces albaduncus OX=68172 GN=FHS32_002681 PE=4 SV=1 [Streptomyces griseoloalbus]
MPDPALWAALADPHRRAVIALLRTGPHTVGEIAQERELSQPSASKHLKVLRGGWSGSARRRSVACTPSTPPRSPPSTTGWRRTGSCGARGLDALGRRLDARPDTTEPTTPKD